MIFSFIALFAIANTSAQLHHGFAAALWHGAAGLRAQVSRNGSSTRRTPHYAIVVLMAIVSRWR
jgi:hypothetical protein